jgi:hypothetical protein
MEKYGRYEITDKANEFLDLKRDEVFYVNFAIFEFVFNFISHLWKISHQILPKKNLTNTRPYIATFVSTKVYQT